MWALIINGFDICHMLNVCGGVGVRKYLTRWIRYA